MGDSDPRPARADAASVAAVRRSDSRSFAALVEQYRGELRVHCYRMLGSLDESEDLLQETLVRAWNRRATFEGRSSLRTWLYRIATNACLDFLRHRRRQPIAAGLVPATDPGAEVPPPVAVAWLQPFPDRLLDQAVAGADEPDAVAVDRETIELAFLAAIQHLPPRQRAVLILRDVLGWSAPQTAEALETSVPAVNSGAQRARGALRRHLPPERLQWTRQVAPSDQEREILRRYMDAIERADEAAIAKLLREDARAGHQPGAGGNQAAEPAWYQGRDTILAGWAPVLRPEQGWRLRFVPTAANRQPAAGCYLRGPEDTRFQPFGLTVLGIEEGLVREITIFSAELFPRFGLPTTIE
jgi:RNA polymerase sigma-70 factor, ECF subfamily